MRRPPGEGGRKKKIRGKDGKRASSVQSFFQGSASSMPSKPSPVPAGTATCGFMPPIWSMKGSGSNRRWVHRAAKRNLRGKRVAVILRRLVNGPQLPHGVVHDGGEDGGIMQVPGRGLPRRFDDARDGKVRRDGGLVFRVCPHVQGQRHARIHQTVPSRERKRGRGLQ